MIVARYHVISRIQSYSVVFMLPIAGDQSRGIHHGIRQLGNFSGLRLTGRRKGLRDAKVDLWI